MQTLKKKDIKNYKVNLKEGGYDNSERLGDDYQEAIEEFLSPILKKLNPIQGENVVMKIYDAMYPEMDVLSNIPNQVEEFIKINYPKLYSRPELNGGVEEGNLDEFVNALGAPISGDEKNVNNTEIKTAPQATSDEFNTVAIQPNRYLYNVNSVGPRVMGVTAEEFDRLAKEKAISLLEGLDSDYNDNAIIDGKELPASVDRGINNLVNSINMNGLSDKPETIDMIINSIINKLKPNA